MRFTQTDEYLFHEGTAREAYRTMGAHADEENGIRGTRFTLWAQNARSVLVTAGGDTVPMERTFNGVWEAFLPGVGPGTRYRFTVEGADGVTRVKADPFAFQAELRPGRDSVVAAEDRFVWGDGDYRAAQSQRDPTREPMAIYEVHLGSWKKNGALGRDGFLNYRTLADQLSDYAGWMGFTHVELMGICEYPLDASWGYQVTGYYAPTSRYGTPEDFRYFVDRMHRAGIGVILDWVPAHFPKDPFGLESFDGTPMYEYADPLRAEYPEWGTKAFDHGRPEVKSFLISNALYWVREFHVDALRVDAVAAMLFLNFSRAEWRPNRLGGTENLESFAFFRELSETLAAETGAYLIAEDSSIVDGVTKPAAEGGLGFRFKWSMGWMNDTLRYVGTDPVFRSYSHGAITHLADYAFRENYVLVLSHDEVVHLKRPMAEKFSGSLMDKLGGLKTLYAFMFTFPGKKLLFMGQEFAEHREWDENRQIDWSLADDPGHRDVMECVRDLLRLYRAEPVLYTDARDPVTFEWVKNGDAWGNTFAYLRRNPWNYDGALLVVCNFSPVAHADYRLGVPEAGSWARVFSTYDHLPDGGRAEPLLTDEIPADGYAHSLTYSLRPYESALFRRIGENG